MKFISTRGKSPAVTASEAIVNGLAPDGGLYVPEEFPAISMDFLKDDLPYPLFAAKIIQPFFEGDPLFDRIPEICQRSFTFDIPLRMLDKNGLFWSFSMVRQLHLRILEHGFSVLSLRFYRRAARSPSRYLWQHQEILAAPWHRRFTKRGGFGLKSSSLKGGFRFVRKNSSPAGIPI